MRRRLCICRLTHALTRSADAATVIRYCWDASTGDFGQAQGTLFTRDFGIAPDQLPSVPWTMVTGPDENLYIAIDVAYDVSDRNWRRGPGALPQVAA